MLKSSISISSKRTSLANSKGHMLLEKYKFYIVAIGASAGGLEAMKTLFDSLPSDTGMVFVIIQHLDPTHKSLLTELIARHTKMPVSEITNGVRVQPNSVYVIPANKDLQINNYKLILSDPSLNRGKHRPIDFFMGSLAKKIGSKAIAVILSGTGADGTKGLSEIKLMGGLAIVQDPNTAHFSGMPENVIKSGMADYILSPDKIPNILVSKKEKNVEQKKTQTLPFEISDQQQQQILHIIKRITGQDFSNYKPNTITRRLNKRIVFSKMDTVDAYIQWLQSDDNEVIDLYHDFLIGVTTFFRDAQIFLYFEKEVLPLLVKKCSTKKSIRIWICGCSTGEEAYSYAILFKEFLLKQKLNIKVEIFASDLNKASIAFARKGKYSTEITQSISATRLQSFFEKHGNYYHIKKDIRDMIIFANHNVINDPPFSKIDFISCRNLLIYLDADLQKRIIQKFCYSLNNDAVLILGPSESLGIAGNQFFPLEEKFRIFRKKNTLSNNINSGFDLNYIKHLQESLQTEITPQKMKKLEVSSVIDKNLIQQNVLPSVIIDKFNEIRYFAGNTNLYLETPSGIAKFDILAMIKKGLKPALESAIIKARKKNEAVTTKSLQFLFADDFKTTKIKVKPLFTKEYELGTLLIVFEEVEKKNKVQVNQKDDLNGKEKQKRALLEKELKITSQHLQIAINELEISREDFNCSTEELQSSNEELETSREELQAVNEELITVNSELTGKIESLSESNNDLSNLLKCIEIATLYLNKELLIKRFTPAATKIFNLIATDIDRPIQQLSINLNYPLLFDDVKLVLKTLVEKTIEVNDKNDAWYLMRIIPYRTSENNIEGVLLTLVDISIQKQEQLNLIQTNEHLTLIMENLPVIPFTAVIKPALSISFIGKTAEKLTGFSAGYFTNKFSFWLNRIHPKDKKQVLGSFESVTSKINVNLSFRWKCADDQFNLFVLILKYVAALEGRPAYIIGVWQEAYPIA